ncbi:MAG: MaoC family dehydratase [Candidatus Calescibacterium sp.]|nr:MaoC family dehydratase [Candidatus Calescibacterium sp.]MCX7733356.1 MaoC family dehydratase [bacterium]MDW8086722.1 MaoC family dehydratase [Candidatus Calescibacterium sp.]
MKLSQEEFKKVIEGTTGKSNYFEDFNPGDVILHHRGRTITEMDNVLFTLLTMNTASIHFNEDMMKKGKGIFPERVVYGGIVSSIVIGLTSEDISENAIADIGYYNAVHKNPVFHGDTLYAESHVLEKRDSDRPDAGIVRFKIIGRNQKNEVVVEIEREVLIRKRKKS